MLAPQHTVKVSIHAPSRERHIKQLVDSGFLQVSIHAPSRERHLLPALSKCSGRVSIHAPSRERHYVMPKDFLYLKSFNPRSLAGATRYNLILHVISPQVSIHAPSRERHNRSCYDRASQTVSIHAPSRERHQKRATLPKAEIVSIHAPSRERHIICREGRSSVNSFNPRSLAGATHSCYFSWYNIYSFNPRSLAGATPCPPGMEVFLLWLFQSTLPRGSDTENIKRWSSSG